MLSLLWPLSYPAGENGHLPSQPMKKPLRALSSAWTLTPASSPGQFLVILLVTSSGKSFSPRTTPGSSLYSHETLHSSLRALVLTYTCTASLRKYLLSVSLPATVQDTGQGLATTISPGAVPGLWRPSGYYLMRGWKTKPGWVAKIPQLDKVGPGQEPRSA